MNAMSATRLVQEYYQEPRQVTPAVSRFDELWGIDHALVGRIGHPQRPQRITFTQHPASGAVYGAVLTVHDCATDAEVSRVFNEHHQLWMQETAFSSSLNDIVAHPSYLRIIGLGRSALPHIFQAMRAEPAHWFVALMAITGEDPLEGRYDMPFDDMTAAWLRWGSAHGYN
jgi:hypothetical protein